MITKTMLIRSLMSFYVNRIKKIYQNITKKIIICIKYFYLDTGIAILISGLLGIFGGCKKIKLCLCGFLIVTFVFFIVSGVFAGL